MMLMDDIRSKFGEAWAIWICLIPLCIVSYEIFRERLGYTASRSLVWVLSLHLSGTLLCGWVAGWEGNPYFIKDLRSLPLFFRTTGGLAELVYLLDGVARYSLIGVLPLFGGPFLIFLYQKWLCGKATEAENAFGREGFRAWLRPWNLVWALGITPGLYFCAGLPIIASIVLILALLGAYPLFRWALGEGEGAGAAGAMEDLSPEREQILRMIEEGKITAEEGAELLSALAAPLMVRREGRASLSKGRRLILAGAGLVLLGFFLPWFQVDINGEMRRLLKSSAVGNRSINAALEERYGNSGQFPVRDLSGGDLGNGLGLAILLLGLVAAALPFVAPEIDDQSRKAVQFVAMGVGAILLLYLLSTSLRFVTYGFVVVLAGYGVQLLGALSESRGGRGRAAG